MGEIIIRNQNFRLYSVWVNLPSPIRQVRVPIWWVITPIQRLLNTNRQIVHLITHIRSYPPYCFHLHTPSLFLIQNSTIIAEHKVESSLSISPCHDHELTPHTAYTSYSIHLIQHTPHTAYTSYSIHPRLPVFPSISRLPVDPWM